MSKVTTQQIADWKKQHGDIFEINFQDDKTGYLRKPNRKELSYAMTKVQSNPLGFAEVIMQNCWLGGDEEIRTDDAYFLGASGQLDSLMEVKAAELKKL
ncbi:hypothetical protein GCM10022289_07700 [Pedobacter jeongneungensis]|uniref:Phage ABA sandwich domain-containing protein n=1 Tax=Pedobacter jeongneungensis TaxID=947309 RepID=A0ABP8B5S7_9SPHI